MFAVERLGSYITRGVNTVSGPFHPFGGAVDIVVVEQPDGTFKSSPWYVRFGKFQGVLKAKEKIVNISVNGVEANFHMYLDHKGVAYFLREVDDDADEVDSLLLASSSGEEADGQYRDRRPIKSKSCNYDTAQSNLVAQIDVSNVKVLARTSSRRSRILGLVFGRKSIKEARIGDEDVADFVRTDSLDRAEIAANLLEVRWSTNLASARLGKEGKGNKDSESSDKGKSMFENSCDTDNLSWTSFRKLERPVEETGVEMSCIGRSAVGQSSDEGNNELNCENPRKVNNISLVNADLDDDMRVVESEIVRSDSQAPDSSMLDQENAYEEDKGVLIEADRVEAIIYSDISEKSRIGSDKFSCRKCGDMKLCAEAVNCSTKQVESPCSVFTNSICVVQDEKNACEDDDINKLGLTLGPVCDSQEITCDFLPSMASEVLSPEGSEEEQFLFSDGEDFKVREADNVSSGLNFEAESSPDRFEELRQESKIISGNVDIPFKVKVGTEEVGRVVKSLPNMGSRFDELGELHHPLLGHSLDSSTKSSKPLSEDSQISEALKNSPATTGAGDLSKIIIDSPSGRWGLWPFKRSRSIKSSHSARISTRDFNAFESINSSMDIERETPNRVGNKRKIRAKTPTSEQLALLNLKEGRNVITFTFSTAMLGEQQVDAQIYLWRWDTRIVISDVDGTITKSDILGQFMPLVGKDWSQTGVANLFSAIKENGYKMLFLSARSISQAYHTRQFLFNLKQDGKALPDGPVVISPDGLFPSLFREVIRRAPHEFKIACLEDIKALFPPDRKPFYAGFGNRDTDEFSYLKVGIPKGKIFIINPKGEVVVNRRVDSKSYTSLKDLVDDMFPPMTSSELEDFNSWNYWKLPPPDIIC